MKDSDKWQTPPDVFEYLCAVHGPFDVDVAAEQSTRQCATWFGPDHEDSLRRSSLRVGWTHPGGKAWCNPPYSDPMPWIEKAIEESKRGVTTVMILPSDPSTKWYRLMAKHSLNYFWKGRIRFLREGQPVGSPKFGTVVAIFIPEFQRKRT